MATEFSVQLANDWIEVFLKCFEPVGLPTFAKELHMFVRVCVYIVVIECFPYFQQFTTLP